MEYNKVIAVTGMPGLYELLNSKTDGAIVRSLDDKSTRFVSSRVHNFSHLESIEIYTVRDNVNLVDVLKAMEDSSEKLPDEKDNAALKNYFSKVYPDIDFDRVYSSDLKKMVKWFSVLQSHGVELKLSEETPEEEGPAEEVMEEEAVKGKSVKEKSATAASPKSTTAAKSPAAKSTVAEKLPGGEKEAKKKPVTEEKRKAPAASAPKSAEKPQAKKKVAPTAKDKAPAAAKPKKTAKKKK
jgi:hypothetical protein